MPSHADVYFLQLLKSINSDHCYYLIMSSDIFLCDKSLSLHATVLTLSYPEFQISKPLNKCHFFWLGMNGDIL